MIEALKRFRFVVACGLFIPFSVITCCVWLSSSITLSIIGYLMIPIEYIITGNTTWCDKMMDFCWIYLPKLYDERTELFFLSKK
jgi:hypothetical protein